MKAIELSAKWSPKPGFKLGSKDIDGKLTYLGSQVWKDPVVKIVEKEKPKIKPNEVLLKVKRCGISPDQTDYYFRLSFLSEIYIFFSSFYCL